MTFLTLFQRWKLVINRTASWVYIKNVHSFATHVCIYLSKMLQQNIPVLGAGHSAHDGRLFTIQPQPVTSAFMSFGAFLELGGFCQTAQTSLVCFMR